MATKYVTWEGYCETCNKVTVFKKPEPTAIWKAGLPPIYTEIEPWLCDGITSKSGKRFEGCGEATMK